MASDLAITKPVGLTTSEFLAVGLPMVVVSPIPGHEKRNAAFLLGWVALLGLFWIVEDFLRFALNPCFGLAKFAPQFSPGTNIGCWACRPIICSLQGSEFHL